MSERRRDKFGRAFYDDNEVPPATEPFAHWRGLVTHPDAVHTPPTILHDTQCSGGWVRSGDWWLHCGRCRPAAADLPVQPESADERLRRSYNDETRRYRPDLPVQGEPRA